MTRDDVRLRFYSIFPNKKNYGIPRHGLSCVISSFGKGERGAATNDSVTGRLGPCRQCYVGSGMRHSQLACTRTTTLHEGPGVLTAGRALRLALWHRIASKLAFFERRTTWDRKDFKQIERVTSGLSSQRSGETGLIDVLCDETPRGAPPPPPKLHHVMTRGKSQG